MKTRKYREGESLPSNICPGCRNHKKSRDGMGTCGHRDCIDYLNTISIKGATKDERDPANGAKIRFNGKEYTGLYSVGEGKNAAIKLKGGPTVQVHRLEFLD